MNRLTFICAITLALPLSCANQGVRAKSDPEKQDWNQAETLQGKEAADYKEIQTLYAAGLHETLFAKLKTFEKKYPQSVQIPQIRNIRGLVFLLTKKPQQAILQFNKSIEASSNNAFNQYVRYNLATAQLDANQIEEATKTLEDIQPNQLDRETRFKYHSLRVRLFDKQNKRPEAAMEILSLAEFSDNGQIPQSLMPQLEDNLRTISDTRKLESLVSEFNNSPAMDLLLFKLGSQEIAEGQNRQGAEHLKMLLEKYPRTPYYAEATELLSRVGETKSEIDPTTIGVLLPTKGKFAQFGQQSLQAIELALKIFNTDEPSTNISIVIEDSGEDAESALRALNTLYSKHHVAAVIGPLLSKGVDQVTQRAQELGLPIITLSQQPGTLGEYVFPAGLTMRSQAREAARFAIERLGLKRFAIIYPKDKFGEQYNQTFWDSVEDLGGTIVGSEAYAPGETDLRQPIDKISGLYYTEARQRELDELAKAKAKELELNPGKKKSSKLDKAFALQPIIDYDAVFIPDAPKMAGQIIPTFAYRDVDKMKFLGTASWHTPELVSRTNLPPESIYFVDAFHPESSSLIVKKFISKYKAIFSQEPAAIEAISYDAASLLTHVLGKATKSRDDIRRELQEITNYPGVTGRISFRDGQFIRNLAILTVQNGKIVEHK